jgi:hypothetical protein
MEGGSLDLMLGLARKAYELRTLASVTVQQIIKDVLHRETDHDRKQRLNRTPPAGCLTDISVSKSSHQDEISQVL